MLLPQSPKKSKVDRPPPLETPEDCRHSEERDKALRMRAKRRKEEAAADRARFQLTREKIVFGFELVVTGVVLITTVVVLAFNPQLIPVALLSGGGIGGLVTVLKRKPTEG